MVFLCGKLNPTDIITAEGLVRLMKSLGEINSVLEGKFSFPFLKEGIGRTMQSASIISGTSSHEEYNCASICAFIRFLYSRWCRLEAPMTHIFIKTTILILISSYSYAIYYEGGYQLVKEQILKK